MDELNMEWFPNLFMSRTPTSGGDIGKAVEAVASGPAGGEGPAGRPAAPMHDARGAEWLSKRHWLSAAVAVIRSRPTGKSGRQHAEALACRLRDQHEDWKNKAHGLQEEVLRLRQELLLSRLASQPKSTVAELFSQDLMSAPDSGCGTENDIEPPHPSGTTPSVTTGNQRPELATSGPAAASLLAFSASSAPGGSHHHPRGKDAMLVHMQFLQSMCGLSKSATDSEDHCGPSVAWLSLDGDTSVMGETVCRLLESVVVACEGHGTRALPPSSMLQQACLVVATAVDLWASGKCPLPEKLLSCVEESLKQLIGTLLNHDGLNRFHLEDKRTNCVVLLGGSSLLKSAIVHHVLSEINRLAEQLWNSCQVTESTVLQQFVVSQYENSIYLFWILEQLLLQKTDDPGQGRTRSSRNFSHQQPWTSTTQQKELLDSLEQRVYLLADEFPLFSLYMWRIVPLLST